MTTTTPPGSDEVTALAAAEAGAGAAAGRLTPTVVDALRRAGLFKLFLPGDLGGLALGLPEGCERIAAVAAADGAAGWAVMIGAGPNFFAGHMAPDLATEVFGASDGAVAGSGTAGRAVAVEGGFRVTGRWRWCSGAPWSTWCTFVVAPPEPATPFVVAVPTDALELVTDTWQVRGLAATASIDVVAHDVVVPAARTFTVDPVQPLRGEPIFAVPFLAFAEATMAAVAVGVSDGLLAHFGRLAQRKTPSFATEPLAAQPLVRDRYARAAGLARAAAAGWRAEVSRLWDAVADPAGGSPPPEVLTAHSLACLHVVRTAAEVADLLEPLTGMTGLALDDPVGRACADARAVGRNAVVAEARFAEVGAALLGSPAPQST